MEMKQFLDAIHKVDDEVFEEYFNLWQPCDFPKKGIITAEGSVEKYMYFVLEGIQKSYHFDDKKDYVIAFTYPPSFSGIPESFFTQKPAAYCLETITKSKMLRISYENHHNQIAKHRQLETLFRKATELLLVGVMQRYIELMSLSIESRFKTFVKRSPHLINQISQKDLASYLRIDATNFSKLINSIKI